jgi:hypothetical protein
MQSPVMPQSPFGMSPFDPWKNFLFGPQGLESAPAPEPAPVAVDPKLALDAPRGAEYFLHATLDKTSAVVGEEITFSIYEYKDASAPEVDGSADHEASVPDFVKRALVTPTDKEQPHVGYAAIGEKIWDVRLISRSALFPLHPGDLAVGSMSVTLSRPRNLAGASRATEMLRVHVTEPPNRGRPAGYTIGDVGHFAVSADVAPRDVEQGGAIAVHVQVSGTGNLPTHVVSPPREGVEWLSPEVHEDLGPMPHDAFGGHRDFDFVVRIRRAGIVDLGEIRIPFWDPEKRAYQVARAALGTVNAKANPNAIAAASDSPPEVLPGLPNPRDTLERLGQPATMRTYIDDSPWFWLGGLAAGPAAFAMAVVGRSAGRRAASAWQRRLHSPLAELRARVDSANAECRGDDVRAADAAIERALYAATIAAARVSVRGALASDISTRLEKAGISGETAARVAGLLAECEAARFSPEDADIQEVRDRWARALRVIRDLERNL